MADEVKARSSESVKAFKNKDYKAVAAFYTDDCRLLNNGKEAICGKAAVEEFFKEVMATEEIENSRTSNVEVKIDGDYAFETGNFSMDTPRGPESGEFLVVWKKIQGKYYTAIDYQNVIKSAHA